MEEKTTAEIDWKQNRFFGWLDNFWYHYKWQTLVCIFFVFTLIFCFTQCATKGNDDLIIVAAGNLSFRSQADRDGITDALEAVAPAKEDGKKPVIALNHYTILSEDEMKRNSYDSNGNYQASQYQTLKSATQNAINNFTTFRMTGECCVYFISASLYEEYWKTDLPALAVPLSECFAEPVEAAYDDYAVSLSETEFYRYYAAMHALPEDTLVILTKPLVVGAGANETTYSYFKGLFQNLVLFER